MLIDEKGKVFGKLNLLDLFFILILLVAVIGACAYFARGGKNTGATLPVTYTLEIQNRDAAYFEHVKEGEQVTDGVNKTYMGKIVSFSKKPAHVITQANDKLLLSHPEGKFDGYVVIEADANVSYPDIMVGDKNGTLKIGKSLALRSESLAMRGYIVSIDYDEKLLEEVR